MRHVQTDIQDLGYAGVRIVLKGDQEPSVVQNQDHIAKSRAKGATTLENSPVESSRSNGAVERAVHG